MDGCRERRLGRVVLAAPQLLEAAPDVVEVHHARQSTTDRAAQWPSSPGPRHSTGADVPRESAHSSQAGCSCAPQTCDAQSKKSSAQTSRSRHMSSRVVNTPVACSLDGANGWDHAVVDIDDGFLQPLEGGLNETEKNRVEIVDIVGFNADLP